MFDKKLITLSIASALLTSSLASANTQDEKDSVYEYGPWGQEFATAAGGELNTNSLNFASFSNNDPGRNSANEPGFSAPQQAPVVEDIAGGCTAGSYCGFAEINFMRGEEQSLPGQVDDVGYIDIDASPSHFSDGDWQEGLTGGFNISGNDGRNINIDGMEGSHSGDYGSMYIPYGTKDNHAHVGYYSRPSWTGWYNTSSNGLRSNGSIYGGITTSLAQLNSFIKANGTTASYQVNTMDGGMGGIFIDFGNKSWNANFDAPQGVNRDASFAVTGGSINGINFTAQSDQLSAPGATVTGIVAGAIFGAQAQQVAGMIDIEKSIAGDEGSPIVRETLFRTNSMMDYN